MTQNKKGFTLIELVVVMALIAILAALGVGAIVVARNTSKLTTHKTNAKTLQVGMESYFSSHSNAYPVLSAVTFTSAATTLGVNLAATGECSTNAGGGAVTSTATGYTITPYDAACSTALTGTDVITGP